VTVSRSRTLTPPVSSAGSGSRPSCSA